MKHSKRGPYRHRQVPRPEVTQPLSKSYRLIPLTRNQIAIVDFRDFERLSQWNWVARYDKDTRSFYACRTTYQPIKKTIQMHREILGCKCGEYTDHKNHDTLDNRRENLRKVTAAQNSANASKHIATSSGYKGVSLHKDRWIARIWVQGRNKHLGCFSSRQAAAYAYDQAAKKFFGEFAHVNGVPSA